MAIIEAMFDKFIEQIGLNYLKYDINSLRFNSIVEDCWALDLFNLSDADIIHLYMYEIPEISPDGSCSIAGKKAEKPYNLAQILGLSSEVITLNNHPQTERLWKLKQVVDRLQKLTKSDWLGVYRKMVNDENELVLVKESYFGAMSRPEFPLTQEFAKHSNNSTVGLTGKAIVVKDVADYNGPYYECDNKVRSEFCCPIIHNDEVIGIIDAESFQQNFFTSEKILQIAKVCFDLGKHHLGI